MTQLEQARRGMTTKEMKTISREEGIPVSVLRRHIALGRSVIPLNRKNRSRKGFRPAGIGKGLRIKVNANIGTSSDRSDASSERKKLMCAIRAGADTVMDLSTGGDIDGIRRMVIRESTVPVGTVPVYQAVCSSSRKGRRIEKMDPEELFDMIEEQAEEGVDFMTVHCGITKKTVDVLRKSRRLTGIVSRGGAFLARWITANRKENPLYEQFDRLCSIAARHDVTLSLGDGLRPGCIADSTDRPQLEELAVLGELTRHARRRSVQVMIEGPGHVPMHRIEENIRLEKKVCDGAPFYVLGPLVTDIAPGYDHITSAIGGAIAGAAGADFLCYVTPAEHLRLPDQEDVHMGVMASRIAAHAADIARGIKGAKSSDDLMSRARGRLDWTGMEKRAIDPELFRKRRDLSTVDRKKACTMCGKFCAMKKV